MKELSLNILDIAMNSVKAGAQHLAIELAEADNELTITIRDDGCGMSEEVVRRLSDPFYTTGGRVHIASVPAPDPRHGTVVTAVFRTDHIDFTPLGDIISTVTTLIHGYPDIDLTFIHQFPDHTVRLATGELKEMLGDIPINSLEILNWIRDYLEEQYSQKEG